MDFEQKKTALLADLRWIALRHNRGYYESLIPLVENATEADQDMIDMYTEVLQMDRTKLMNDRSALETIDEVDSILS